MRRNSLVLALLLSVLTRSSLAAQGTQPLGLGQAAPDFRLKGVDERMYTLKDFAGAKILAIIFTCNHCPTAQAYEERIKKLVTDYKDKGVAVVAISPNDPLAVRLDELGYTDLSDSFEDGQIRARDHKFNFPYLYDGDTQEVTKKYLPRATPHVFIFDKERKLRYRGGIDDSERLNRVKKHHVRNALDALLAGKPVPEADTRAFGCSIKWASKRGSVKDFMNRVAAENVSLEKMGEKDVESLLKNDSKKLRLIYIWTTKSRQVRYDFPEFVTMNRMYRGRNFELVTICVDAPVREKDVLAFLKEQQASCRNLLVSAAEMGLVEALEDEWKEDVVLTVLLRPGGEVAYEREGKIDPLETKRAIVDILGRTY